MGMETKSQATQLQDAQTCNSNGSCSTWGCGGPGLCPGVALLIAYLVGGGIAFLSGLVWLGWVVGIPTALILITGAWRFLPNRKES
jgi:hypothetical protein